MQPVKIEIAQNIPSNNYIENAFRSSFFYKRSSRTLFIRSERLKSIGDFVMVVIHCVSHISVNQLEKDSDPYFLRSFYKVCYYIYFYVFFSEKNFIYCDSGFKIDM